ncbi:hypothetical protein [Methylotenera sp.]|uniref:hypothetical protein n=1 Tax=Methylotenera sp. TaxID=2051956 RepID=UPI002EDA2540
MTISSETRKAGPFNGNGVTTSFPFVFKTFAKSDVKVIFTDANEIETILVLDSDYTVTLNVDQNANPGGSISYSTLATGQKLTVLGAVEYTQETDVQNQGGFYPEVIENALDKITMLIQQVKEIADRSIVVPASSSVTSENYLDTINTYKVEAAASASAASTSASNADSSAVSALVASELAEKWASEDEDVPITTGEFSAKHWAAKAMVAVTGMLSKAGGIMTGLLSQAAGSDIASASTVDLTAATGNTVRITGTTAITAFTMNAGQQMELVAVGALPLTYNATTMNINGGVSYICAAGDRLKVFKDGAGVVRVNVTKQDGLPIVPSTAADIVSFTAVANTPANSVTITAPAATRAFRNSTLNNGQPIQRTAASAKTLVISSGSTLGIPNGVLGRVAVLAIDNGTDWDLGVVNLAGGVQLDETNLISTTAEGGAGAADSASVIYSTSALSSKPYRVIGFLDTTQATSGTYVTALSLVQGAGGQALAALSSLGYGQVWTNVTGSRSVSTTYYNTTGKPIQVNVYAGTSGSGGSMQFIVGGVTIGSSVNGSTVTNTGFVSGVVPPGVAYSVTVSNWAIQGWHELR